jgi:hypothetical protein
VLQTLLKVLGEASYGVLKAEVPGISESSLHCATYDSAQSRLPSTANDAVGELSASNLEQCKNS